MELSLDNLAHYGSTAIDSYEDVRLTHEDLYEAVVDDYDLLEYQSYFPSTMEGSFTDVSFMRGYPLSLRVGLHRYWDGRGVDMEQAGNDLSPCGAIDAERELERYIWDAAEHAFVIDDHNHALAAWTAAYHDGLLDRETTLLHVDQHKDMAAGGDRLPEDPPASMEQAERFIGRGLCIDEFIEQAITWDLIDRDNIVHWGVGDGPHDTDHLSETIDAAETLILDLDLDVFPALYSDIRRGRCRREVVYGLLGDAMEQADITTIATSPGYLDQATVPSHLKRLAATRP